MLIFVVGHALAPSRPTLNYPEIMYRTRQESLCLQAPYSLYPQSKTFLCMVVKRGGVSLPYLLRHYRMWSDNQRALHMVPSRNPHDVPPIAHNNVKRANPFEPANLDYWAKMPFWTLDEMSCVTCGFEPRPLFQATPVEQAAHPECLETVLARQLLIERAILSGKLQRQIVPKDGLAWLSEINEALPLGLLERVEKMPSYGIVEGATLPGGSVQSLLSRLEIIEANISADADTSNSSSQTRLISSLRKILLIVAVEKYRYDPDSSRNTAPRSISDAAALYELSVSDDTVRKHLEEAAVEHWNGPFR